jgi:hypothetical protein
MTLEVTLRGRIAEGPVALEVTIGDEPATAMIVSDAQTGLYGDATLEVPHVRCCEVVCYGDAALNVLERLGVDDPIVAVGELRISAPLDRYNDQDLVIIHLEARAIGLDLAAT